MYCLRRRRRLSLACFWWPRPDVDRDLRNTERSRRNLFHGHTFSILDRDGVDAVFVFVATVVVDAVFLVVHLFFSTCFDKWLDSFSVKMEGGPGENVSVYRLFFEMYLRSLRINERPGSSSPCSVKYLRRFQRFRRQLDRSVSLYLANTSFTLIHGLRTLIGWKGRDAMINVMNSYHFFPLPADVITSKRGNRPPHRAFRAAVYIPGATFCDTAFVTLDRMIWPPPPPPPIGSPAQ